MDTTRVSYKKDSIVTANNKVYNYTTIETTDKTSKFLDSHFYETLIWPLTILIIIWVLKEKIKILIDSVIKRLNDGSEVSLPGGFAIKPNSITTFDEQMNLQTFDPSFPLENNMAKKILSTFWIEQNKHDSTFNNRWTFISSGEDFGVAIGKLVLLGVVAFEPLSKTYFLTDFGIFYCKKNNDKIGNFSFFG